ncbi:unnamed protein product [Lepeophtheirus salmonis]|uniref:(salmon louse) hypothetical protein n=1 Tax=Lepeophtheirus salmonis TaxID=72036 RepID=A0A7R8CKM9_LEPSM|nr:unnamed protein product [Lepeophtheirus salmonis]CAF2817293.1 unnamed protein product [Lepeophtheirus salmonis]
MICRVIQITIYHCDKKGSYALLDGCRLRNMKHYPKRYCRKPLYRTDTLPNGQFAYGPLCRMTTFQIKYCLFEMAENFYWYIVDLGFKSNSHTSHEPLRLMDGVGLSQSKEQTNVTPPEENMIFIPWAFCKRFFGLMEYHKTSIQQT